MIIQTARGSAPEDLIDTAYGDAMITLPMAPSDGLFLDKPSFEKYNERATQAGMGGSLDWEADAEGAGSRVPPPPPCVRERILAFKDEHIVGHITREVKGAGDDARMRAVILMITPGMRDMGRRTIKLSHLHAHTRTSPPPPHHQRQEPRTLAFSKWLYHARQRFEKRPRSFQPRDLTVAELRSEVPKKLRRT